jgi:aminoglycoside/choline kinase family phosphotransferase
MSDFVCLQEWVEKFLPTTVVSQDGVLLERLNGDAGFRQYFRLNTEPSLIAVSAPPNQENTPAFVEISLCLQQQGLRTPLIYAVDFQRGFLLLEDFGDQLLLPLLTAERVDHFYNAAETELLKIQQIPTNLNIFPIYDRQKLMSEMDLFPEWFVEKLLGIELQSVDRQLLNDTFSMLAENALAQPQVVVHRDFHSRNLMNLSNSSIGVIDFQDAVIGPVTYDMVSLLRDCYIRWPADYVSRRALDYYQRAVGAGIVPQVSEVQVLRWFDLMGLQRHIKVLGIFARLSLRDGKQGYLSDLPLVIRYTLEQLELYPELQQFKSWFDLRVLPQLSQHSWHQS